MDLGDPLEYGDFECFAASDSRVPIMDANFDKQVHGLIKRKLIDFFVKQNELQPSIFESGVCIDDILES